MSSQGLPELLDKIEQASAECRELITTAHEAARDLKTVMREARETVTAIEEAAHKAVEERVNEAVAAGLEEYKGMIQRQMKRASQKVIDSFDRLTNVLRTGNEQGRGEDVLAAIEAQARQNGNGS